MAEQDTQPVETLAFYTVVEDSESGAFGGLLVTNQLGRPVEFHCTTPVKPNRAQEILYGSTLQEYLYGELIGQTLLGKLSTRPQVVCVEREPAEKLHRHTEIPVLRVFRGDEPDAASTSNFGTIEGQFGAADDSLPRSRWCGPPTKASSLVSIVSGIDLLEPFERIHRAIEEARRAS